ncbi:hypothetical protein EJ06DRAFT_534827 [Trichodelitschia bisporula]|uniref:Glycoside hydrolase family 125 protein n=1 Tax=Trichodelitschia bisporula TaxID=703511 RepID=A0A6G1HIG9_9PEZI|nr:hypothetical protein EJ06DRAFT_534827 [Trichodelitschia bisporula]
MAIRHVLAACAVFTLSSAMGAFEPVQNPLSDDYKLACPDYASYSKHRHGPYSEGRLRLPYQRPAPTCRTFHSDTVEKVITDVTERMLDPDLARIFENAFPNTLDTTVRWHVDSTKKKSEDGRWEGPQSFIVTGDINAEWLRDSTNQLAGYQALAKKDKKLANLIHGAINTQAEFVIAAPYCNAFQPPPLSGLAPTPSGQGDSVQPMYQMDEVFECKYELDSLAAFLALGNEFYEHTGSTAFVTPRWERALETLLLVLDAQMRPTFDTDKGSFVGNEYTFQRRTNTGTETLSLAGLGNPLNGGTGLIRSAFRPSDDATILGFLVPANAMMSVELKRLGAVLKAANKLKFAADVLDRADRLEKAVWEHGVVEHKKYGRVFAYEVDGYGSQIMMDDANLPSLLALPVMGFVGRDDPVYKNTRRMVLSKAGNPYFLTGDDFKGIGGPHIGLQHAWPMAVLVQAMTSEDDDEITRCVQMVRNASILGLVHESINVDINRDYTRSWFAWANSVFSMTILDLAKRKPHLIFGSGAKPYVVE